MSTDEWVPLGIRQGWRELKNVLFEGVPEHLAPAILQWLAKYGRMIEKEDTHLFLRVALEHRYTIEPDSSVYYRDDRYLAPLVRRISGSGNEILELVDRVLKEGNDLIPTHLIYASELEALLNAGGSTWMVSPSWGSLVRRVDPVAVTALGAAAELVPSAGHFLRQAWELVYGVNPDASKGWSQAIKAVEQALAPVVVPKKKEATLGDVRGELVAHQALRGCAVHGQKVPDIEQAAFVIQAIESIWPNPDRHGGVGDPVEVDLEQARGVVDLAVFLIALAGRGGVYRKK